MVVPRAPWATPLARRRAAIATWRAHAARDEIVLPALRGLVERLARRFQVAVVDAAATDASMSPEAFTDIALDAYADIAADTGVQTFTDSNFGTFLELLRDPGWQANAKATAKAASEAASNAAAAAPVYQHLRPRWQRTASLFWTGGDPSTIALAGATGADNSPIARARRQQKHQRDLPPFDSWSEVAGVRRVMMMMMMMVI
jgi:hypothetical protein